MWFLVLILAVLFGYELGKAEKISLAAIIVAFVAPLLAGWIFGLILSALVPELATFMLTAETQIAAYITLDIIGIILGAIGAKAKALMS